MSKTGIICTAYGTPRSQSAADIEAYYTHIRGGRKPSPEALSELVDRYQAIGGSPLEEITNRQAQALAQLLEVPVWVGMKHAEPFISAAVEQARTAGVTRLIGLPLAPHYAAMSLGAYKKTLQASWEGELEFIPGFHTHPAFISAVRSLLGEALAGFEADRLFFTIHSLPARILAEGDGYADRFRESCEMVSTGLQLPPWQLAYQSVSDTGEPWLGPDLLPAIEASGARRVLVCPIGFVSDHLEILYDLDVEAQEFAQRSGREIRRTASFNDRPEFIEALASVVRDHL
ncbi:MAG: ferrochelatase [Candidatus Dormibacteraceae bacterium]